MTKRLILCLLLVISLVPMATFGQVRALKSGWIVDPSEGSTIKGKSLIIDGDRIVDIVADDQIPEGSEIIDLSSMYVLPGLIDSHTHLCNRFEAKGDVGNALLLYSLVATTAERALHGVSNARSMLQAGFTTVRDMGNAGNYADTALKKAIEEGTVIGPTYFVSGKIIAPFGGQFILGPEFPDIGKQDYLYADSIDELRNAIRQNIHYGVDWIKIVIDDYPYVYSVEDIEFIVKEAASAGLKVAAHCVTERGARHAVEGGLASVEHGFEMSDDLLRLAKQKEIFLVATDLTQEIMDIYNFFTATREEIMDRLQRAHRIGVQLVYGSDVISDIPGHTRGSASLSLIHTWVEAKIPHPDILRAITWNGALLLGIQDECGRLRPGMQADIVATPGNPLKDIRALEKIGFVMKSGHVIRQDH